MISIQEWRSFPIYTKITIINMVYGSNIESELKKIKDDILSNGTYESEIIKYITPVHKCKLVGNYYEVKSLVYVKNSTNVEIDNS